MRRSKRDRCGLLQNKTMDSDCYKLRRMVIDELYQFKTIVKLPRIEVRICETSHNGILGVARLGTRQIWVPENCLKRSRAILRHVICHELGHAILKLGHDDNCIIMKPTVSDRDCATNYQIETFLLSHFEAASSVSKRDRKVG